MYSHRKSFIFFISIIVLVLLSLLNPSSSQMSYHPVSEWLLIWRIDLMYLEALWSWSQPYSLKETSSWAAGYLSYNYDITNSKWPLTGHKFTMCTCTFTESIFISNTTVLSWLCTALIFLWTVLPPIYYGTTLFLSDQKSGELMYLETLWV